MGTHDYRVEIIFPNKAQKSRLVKADYPIEAFDLALKAYQKEEVALEPTDKAKANVRVSLVNGSRQSISYYRAKFEEAGKKKAQPAAPVAQNTKSAPNDLHLIATLYDRDERCIVGVVLGRTTTKKQVAECVWEAHDTVNRGEADCDGEVLEEILPKDCQLIWVGGDERISW